MRKRLAIAVVGLVAAVLLVLTQAPGAMAAPQGPIKIGVANSLTGPLSVQGGPMVNAIKQAFDEENYTVAGRRIELIVEDDEGKPDVGLTKFRKLVERDQVHILHAVLGTTVALAAAPYVHAQKVPWVTQAASGALARQLRSPYIFRFVPSEFQYTYAAASYLKDKLGWKRVYWMAWDAAVTHSGFVAGKKVFGDGVVDVMWTPVGTADYAPYLAKVDRAKADGLVLAMWGADAPRIIRQISEYGLKKDLPVFGVASFTSEELLGGMPPEAEGVLSMYNYCGSLNTPANRRFIEVYRTRNNTPPGSYQYMAYMGAKMVIQAIKDVAGNVEDKEAFLSALRKVKVDGPMGPASFDERQGGVFDFYVLKVVKKDGRLQNDCTEKISQVKDPYDLFP